MNKMYLHTMEYYSQKRINYWRVTSEDSGQEPHRPSSPHKDAELTTLMLLPNNIELYRPESL